MKYIYTAAMISLAIAAAACSGSKDVPEKEYADKIEFSQNELTIMDNEETALPVSYSQFDRGIYKQADYDFAANSLGIKLSSDNTDVATVSDDGKVKGVSAGTATIFMKKSNGTVLDKLALTVKSGELKVFTQDITQPLTSANIFLYYGLRNKTMQGMDVDKHGVCYQTYEDTYDVKVLAFNKDGSQIGTMMSLPSGGHGDGFSIEYGSDDVYFWTSGTMGEHESNGGYKGGKASSTDVRLICRHKYESGSTQYAEDAVERWYLNDNGCRFVDVDTEHDVMACWTYVGSSDYMYVYRLSEIRNASKIKKTITRTSHNSGVEVECYDLNTVKPLSSFSWQRKGVTTGETNSGAVQGLCVYDDRIYVLSGAGTDDAALMSVMDLTGTIVQKLVPVGVSSDKDALKTFDLSETGSFEPEGVHIHNGEMYLGFAGHYTTSGATQHCCILKLQ